MQTARTKLTVTTCSIMATSDISISTEAIHMSRFRGLTSSKPVSRISTLCLPHLNLILTLLQLRISIMRVLHKLCSIRLHSTKSQMPTVILSLTETRYSWITRVLLVSLVWTLLPTSTTWQLQMVSATVTHLRQPTTFGVTWVLKTTTTLYSLIISSA